MAFQFPSLRLTSPPTKNADVKRAQYLLKHNRYGIDFMPSGQVDGEFGPTTAAATHRAKLLLGYAPKRFINGRFGRRLLGYLVPRGQAGYRPRPPWMVLLGNRRQRAKTSLGLQALHTAQTQIGVKENPYGSNRVKYTVWYGYTGPWCAMFVSWCLAQHRSKFRYAYVPAMVEDARQARNGLHITHTPGPGTIVAYDWEQDGTADHTGFFERWIVHGYSFYAIEGNTSFGSNSNGGQVMRRERFVSNVQAYIEVTR